MSQSAENDVPPEHIGYTDPWWTTEYGIFEDRRSKGLGFALILTTESLDHAREAVVRQSAFPLFVRQRVVTYLPWGRVPRTRVIPPDVTE